MKNSIKNLCLVLILSMFLSSCDKNKDVINQYDVKEFFDEFVETNSETIFNDELERVKVTYFREANMLFYTFKNEEKLKNNGELFLSFYVKDTSKLSEKRKKHGFINVSINKNEIFKQSDTRNYLIKKLQFPFQIESMTTGQSKNNKKTWVINYGKNDLEHYQIDASLITNNSKEIFEKFKYNTSRIGLGNIGVKVYANANNKIEVYYNTNNRTITSYFGKLDAVIKNGEFVINTIVKSDSVISKKIDLTKINQYKNTTITTYKLEENLDITHIAVQQNNWKKKINVYNLINYTHVKDIQNKKFNKLSDEDRSYILTDYLLTNTLKLVYSKADKIEFYCSGSKRNFYVKNVFKTAPDNLIARVYSKDTKYTNNQPYKEIDFKSRKRLMLSNKKEKTNVYYFRTPFNISKIELGIKENGGFTMLHSFKK